MQRAYHAISLSGGEAPEYVQLLPLGTFMGRDGRGPYRVTDPEAVIRASLDFAAGADLPIDYDHQLEFKAANGQPAPAAGWIKSLEARPNGIWARVEWTARAAAHIKACEFRYLSPVFYHSKLGGQIIRLESAALLNNPNLTLKALAGHERGENEMDLKKLLQALGLPEATTEEAALAKLGELRAAHAASSENLGKLGQALGVPEAKPDELVLLASSLTAKAAQAAAGASGNAEPDPAKYAPLSALESVTKELAALQAERAKENAERAVASAMSAGKVSPAMQNWAVNYASKDMAGFNAWEKAAPVIVSPGGETLPAGQPQTGLSAEQKTLCSTLGLDEATYKKALGVKEGE